MKVSKKSWHYRLIKWMWKKDPTVVNQQTGDVIPMSLCRYMYVLLAVFLWFISFPFALLVGIGMMIMILPVVLISEMVEWWEQREEQSDSIWWSWLKAKKAKVCPMIEWEE